MSYSTFKEMSKINPQMAGIVRDYRPICKFIVRSFHTFLAVCIPMSLVLTKTEIHTMLHSDSCLNILLYIFVWFISLLSYHLTYLIGPGYVPLVNEKGLDNSENSDLNIHIDADNNSTVFRKCGFCGVQQPLRAHHCEDCGRCIRKFDHHCPWFDTCIGELNHKTFLLFLISTIILMYWSFTVAWDALLRAETWEKWFTLNFIFVVDLFWLALGHLIMVPLSLGHLYLMTVNATTWEFISRERIRYLKHLHFAKNPFDEGFCRNVYGFLCRCRHKRWEHVYMRRVGSFEIV